MAAIVVTLAATMVTVTFVRVRGDNKRPKQESAGDRQASYQLRGWAAFRFDIYDRRHNKFLFSRFAVRRSTMRGAGLVTEILEHLVGVLLLRVRHRIVQRLERSSQGLQPLDM